MDRGKTTDEEQVQRQEEIEVADTEGEGREQGFTF
jgi:hypothetical protein